MSRIQDFVRPHSIDEAVEVKAQVGERGFFLAGGTDALVFTPPAATTAIDIMRLGLDRVREEDGKLVIGATALLRDIERRPEVTGVADGALTEAIRETGPWLIRNAATLAGNLCNASPSADSAPMLLALDAEIVLSDGRTVPLNQFFVGPHRTILQDEIVTEVRLDARGRRGHFHKHSRSKSDVAQVNLAVSARVQGDTLHDVRIALGSVAPTPTRAPRSEQLLEGKAPSEALLKELTETVRSEIQPITDWRATADYRRHVTGVLVTRGIRIITDGTMA